ncbi:hypothetical protein ES705_38729 [subsurface metagenome]
MDAAFGVFAGVAIIDVAGLTGVALAAAAADDGHDQLAHFEGVLPSGGFDDPAKALVAQDQIILARGDVNYPSLDHFAVGATDACFHGLDKDLSVATSWIGHIGELDLFGAGA